MRASDGTHRLTKRSAVLDPPLIAGIAVVAVLLNLILALSVCVVKDRQRLRRRRRRISAPIDVEKYESSVAFAVQTGAIPVAITTKTTGLDRKSYFDLIQALQRPPGVPAPTRQSHGPSSSPADNTPLSTHALRPRDIKEPESTPRYPKPKGRVQALRQSALLMLPDGATLTRSNSLAETASVYSSASAPMDCHEQMLRTQPFALHPNGRANAISLPKRPPPAVVLDVAEHVGRSAGGRTPPAPEPIAQNADTKRRPSHPDVPSTPTMSPTLTQSPQLPSSFRVHAQSNPHSPPRVQWLQPPERPSAPTPQPQPKRPGSTSSLSMIVSLHQAHRFLQAQDHKPVHALRPYKEFRAPSALPIITAAASPVAAPTAPTIPARSPRRPNLHPSGSVEHLP